METATLLVNFLEKKSGGMKMDLKTMMTILALGVGIQAAIVSQRLAGRADSSLKNTAGSPFDEPHITDDNE